MKKWVIDMWPLGSIRNGNDNHTSLQQLYSMSFHYGWSEDYRNMRKRLLVLAFAPAASALNDAIRKHGSHVNMVSGEKWDLVCPGFSVEGDPLAHTRVDEDLLGRAIEFNEKSYYNFVKEVEPIFLGGRESRYAKSLFYTSAGGFLLADVQIGEKEVHVDWTTSWVLEQRTLDQVSIKFDFLSDLIHSSQLGQNFEKGPADAAVRRITSEVSFQERQKLASRVDPASLVISGLSLALGGV